VEIFQIQIQNSLFQMLDSRICWHIVSIFGHFQKHISYFGAYSREHIRTFSEHLQPVLRPVAGGKFELQEEIFKLGAVAGGRFEKYNIPFENLKL